MGNDNDVTPERSQAELSTKEHPLPHWVLEERGQESRALRSEREQVVYPRSQEPTGFSCPAALSGRPQAGVALREEPATHQQSQGAEDIDVRGWPQVSRGEEAQH